MPIIALLFTPFLKWLKKTKLFRKLGQFVDNKIKKHSEDLTSKTVNNKLSKKTLIKCLLIGLFVAVPLPLTGVWTGTCVAVAIGLKFWQTCLSVILGNVVAGLIIMFVCSVFPGFTTILFYIFLIIIAFIIVYGIIKFIISARKNKETIV